MSNSKASEVAMKHFTFGKIGLAQKLETSCKPMLIPYQSSAVKSAATFLAWDMLAALETTSLGRGLLPKQKHGAKIRKYPLGGPARKLDQSYVKINLNTPLKNSAARDMLEHIHKLLCKWFFSQGN